MVQNTERRLSRAKRGRKTEVGAGQTGETRSGFQRPPLRPRLTFLVGWRRHQRLRRVDKRFHVAALELMTRRPPRWVVDMHLLRQVRFAARGFKQPFLLRLLPLALPARSSSSTKRRAVRKQGPHTCGTRSVLPGRIEVALDARPMRPVFKRNAHDIDGPGHVSVKLQPTLLLLAHDKAARASSADEKERKNERERA